MKCLCLSFIKNCFILISFVSPGDNLNAKKELILITWNEDKQRHFT
ncbi:hypothetical protein ACFP3I_15735 [Chryseobacterium arachidis]